MFGLPGEMRLLRGQRLAVALEAWVDSRRAFRQSERADAIPGLGQSVFDASWQSSDLSRCRQIH